jgi:hypothetical protein
MLSQTASLQFGEIKNTVRSRVGNQKITMLKREAALLNTLIFVEISYLVYLRVFLLAATQFLFFFACTRTKDPSRGLGIEHIKWIPPQFPKPILSMPPFEEPTWPKKP